MIHSYPPNVTSKARQAPMLQRCIVGRDSVLSSQCWQRRPTSICVFCVLGIAVLDVFGVTLLSIVACCSDTEPVSELEHRSSELSQKICACISLRTHAMVR